VADCQTGTVWASLVLQAYSYAAANGAHIVLSSATAEAAGGDACSAAEAWPSCEAARAAAFADGLRPLELAGMLVVAPAYRNTSSSSSSGGGSGDTLPCTLAERSTALLCAADSAFSNAGSRNSSRLSLPAAGLYSAFAAGSYASAGGSAVAAAATAGAAALAQGAAAARFRGNAEGIGPMSKAALLQSYTASRSTLNVAAAVDEIVTNAGGAVACRCGCAGGLP